MAKQNVLVTGANGFIGKALINGLDRCQYNVYALDSNPFQNSDDIQVNNFFLQDITLPFTVEEPMDYVIHLAALNITHVGKEEYEEYRRVNVLGTENLIKAVKARNFVYLSTVKVYKNQDGTIDEDSPLGPASDYERSKLEAEEVCRSHVAQKALTIFRAVNIVGPGQKGKAVIPVFFKKAINHEALEVIYSSRTLVQLLDIEDVVRAFCLALERGHGLGIINLCPEEIITLGELANEVVAICRSKSPIDFKNDDEVILTKVISKKAETALGWKANASVNHILNKYYKFISTLKK